ncbi:hypothetical protein HK101_006508 [Irineochytrium annulatum]|nr:hypothetical protein HK101_006508 [Irineochytrium annulatum]
MNLVMNLKRENKKLREKVRIYEEIEARYREAGECQKQDLEDKLADSERRANALLAQRTLLITERENVLASLGSLDNLGSTRNLALGSTRNLNA